jgi:hypothetical protein
VCVVFCYRRSSVFILSVLRTSEKKQKQKNSLLLHPLHLTCCPFDFTCYQQRLFRVSHYHLTLHYFLSVLILDLSAAYLELHIFLCRAYFVPPIFREFHRLVAGRPCVRGKNRQEFDNNISLSTFVSCSTPVLASIFVSCLR